jgi:hypothetical protein
VGWLWALKKVSYTTISNCLIHLAKESGVHLFTRPNNWKKQKNKIGTFFKKKTPRRFYLCVLEIGGGVQVLKSLHTLVGLTHIYADNFFPHTIPGILISKLATLFDRIFLENSLWTFFSLFFQRGGRLFSNFLLFLKRWVSVLIYTCYC